jgi:hypothetical protein
MVSGKAKAQNLFMNGKLKVKGNVMKGEFWNIDVIKMGKANVDGEQRRRWSPYWQRQRQKRSFKGWRRYVKVDVQLTLSSSLAENNTLTSGVFTKHSESRVRIRRIPEREQLCTRCLRRSRSMLSPPPRGIDAANIDQPESLFQGSRGWLIHG